MIEFQNVIKKYGNGTVALDDVSFSIEKGAFVYLVGPTGSGKTTIFRLIIRDLLPTSGDILLDEWSVVNLPKNKIPTLRRKVGTVFQDLKLLIDRTVLENVILPLEFSGVPDKQAQSRAIELINSVGLEGMGNKFPQQLSGGEKQRVAVARALIFEPPILLADEPTGNLDTATSLQIIELFEKLNKERGTTILMATHNSELIEKTKKRVIALKSAKIDKDTPAANE